MIIEENLMIIEEIPMGKLNPFVTFSFGNILSQICFIFEDMDA